MPEIEIRPPRKWGELRLGELWEFRELLYFLLKRELQVRYKQSFLGVSWAVLQPVVLAGLFTLFFGLVINIPADGAPYAVFALSGLVPWLFVSQSIALSSGSMVADANLLSKVYFPRLALPLSKIASLTLDLVVAFGVLLVIALLYGVSLGPTLALIPGFMVIGVIAAVGVGCLLAALNVRYRDVTVMTPLLLQVWLFSSPIIYPSSLIIGKWKYVYALNPLSSMIDGIRWCLFGTPQPDLILLVISLASALAILVAGVLYFRRTEQYFADIV